MDRLEKIKYVVDNSDDVKININKLKEYADKLIVTNKDYWLMEKKLNFTEKEYILLVFIMQAMDFCFWMEPHIEKEFDGLLYKKSLGLFYAVLDEAISNKDFLNINYLINLTKKDLAKILNSDINAPMLDERYNNLMQNIEIINNKGDIFYKELFSIYGTDELLEYIVSNFPSFEDISNYKGQSIKFYKRATLLVYDLFEVSKTIKQNIKDVDSLLGGADYTIPKIFRFYGVLEYSEELDEIINSKKIIDHDSNLEIEIRANMLYALELIKGYLNSKGIILNTIKLDNIIWLSGRNIKTEHHRTKSIFY